MTRSLRHMLAPALSALLAGCFAPDLEDGGFLCSTEQCPEGYTCKLEGKDLQGHLHQVCRPAPLLTTDPGVQFRVIPPTTVGGDGKSKVAIEVTKTENFVLSPDLFGKAAKKGHGHYHLFFDLTEPYIAASASVKQDVPIPTTAPGKHWLRMVLFENDHTPVAPWTEWAVQILVTK